MLIDTWHHYLLLRPLLVFVLATPLIVFAVLFRGHDRGAETHDSSEVPEALSDTSGGNAPPENETRVETSPREWQARDPRSDRHAA